MPRSSAPSRPRRARALGEDVEDEWQYVQDLGRLADAAREVAAGRGAEAVAPARGRRGRPGDRRDRPDRGSAPGDRLAVDVPAGRPACPRRAAVRFQDAAPDARAVVYAGIQADPLVARAADLLADATSAERLLARAVMNGEIDRRRTPGGRCFRRCSAADVPGGRERAEAILAAVAGGRRSRRAGPQPVPRRDRRVADRAAPRRRHASAPPTAVRRERRILFDGVRAEIHPYDVTVEIDGARPGVDCKWGARGISADVLHQLDDARTHAADEDERLARRPRHLRLAAVVRRSASSARPRPTPGPRSSASRRSTTLAAPRR